MATDVSRFIANHKEYTDIFTVFSRSRREQEKSWVENDLVPKIRGALMQDAPDVKSEFKILAVGSNVGSFDSLLLKALFSHAKELVEGKQVVYTVVEPNTVAIAEFKHNVSLQDGVFRNIKFEWVNKRVEEFFEAMEQEEYDLIQFVHCLYYVENHEESLRTAFETFLASPGCILSVVLSKANMWVKLIESFEMKVPTLATSQLGNVELSEVCKRNGWAHEIFDAKLDLEVTELFNEKDPVGQALLKFFFQIYEEPKEMFGTELVTEMIEYIGRMSWEKMKDGKRCLFVTEDEGILLTYKRC